MSLRRSDRILEIKKTKKSSYRINKSYTSRNFWILWAFFLINPLSRGLRLFYPVGGPPGHCRTLGRVPSALRPEDRAADRRLPSGFLCGSKSSALGRARKAPDALAMRGRSTLLSVGQGRIRSVRIPCELRRVRWPRLIDASMHECIRSISYDDASTLLLPGKAA